MSSQRSARERRRGAYAARAAAGRELGPWCFGVPLTRVLDLGEEPAACSGSVGRDVPSHRGQRWIDDLAEQRVVPRDDGYVVGHREAHLLRDAEPLDREQVAVEDERGRSLG